MTWGKELKAFHALAIIVWTLYIYNLSTSHEKKITCHLKRDHSNPIISQGILVRFRGVSTFTDLSCETHVVHGILSSSWPDSRNSNLRDFSRGKSMLFCLLLHQSPTYWFLGQLWRNPSPTNPHLSWDLGSCNPPNNLTPQEIKRLLVAHKEHMWQV